MISARQPDRGLVGIHTAYYLVHSLAAEDFGSYSGSPIVTSNGTASGSALVWATNNTSELRVYDAVPVAGWLKVPAGPTVRRMLSVSTLPALILGGAPGPDPEAAYASWADAMTVPTVRGLVVGRALLYPADGDVAGAIERAAGIVRTGGQGG
jgi:hypothetical protein